MFNCDCCGLCCRHISGIKMLEAFDDRTGTCIYLDRDNDLCTIYDSRPVICNIDAMYDIFFSRKMTREEFYAMNRESCMRLKREHES
ncbi:MAG: hypothetical protein IJP86_06795 [Synergistaceae bacterium]|nr:hypothetical protein [Synergistaceae bacterium]